MEVGSIVWVPDPTAVWVAATISKRTDLDNDVRDLELQILLTGARRSLRLTKNDYQDPETSIIKPQNTFNSSRGCLEVDDLITLTHLHEAAILDALYERYKEGMIYTLTGSILLALNPFKLIPGLYSPECLASYFVRGTNTDRDPDASVLPHVYMVADNAYHSMMRAIEAGAFHTDSVDTHNAASRPVSKKDGKSKSSLLLDLKINQSILVSGESGAGKTETTKIIMQYLAIVGAKESRDFIYNLGLHTQRQSTIESDEKNDDGIQHEYSIQVKKITDGEQSESIQQKILECNPILESFGNARTVRNDNSSRFGKYIVLEFDSNGNLIGSCIHTYLLEKIRLVRQQEDERTFHIFYEIITGASDELRAKLSLPTIESSCYVNQGNCISRRDGVDDAKQFTRTIAAMKHMDFSDEDIDSVLRVVTGILLLGNIAFQEKAHASDDSAADIPDSSLPALIHAAELLAVSPEHLQAALTIHTIKAGGDNVAIKLSPSKAVNARDALAKVTYGKLFSWMVARINDAIVALTDTTIVTAGFIGVLDIFGFEVFKENSFEQFLINYTNEALQKLFNDFIFQLEQQEYEKEGIDWTFIDFPDNTPVLELIEGSPSGLLKVLDNECLFPRGNDDSFLNKLYDGFKSNSKFKGTPRDRKNRVFKILHYAGEVDYCVEGFCEKNKDALFPEGTELLSKSSNPLIQQLFGSRPAPVRQSILRKNSVSAPALRHDGQIGEQPIFGRSLGAQFKTQLHDLLKTIRNTVPHYVRCLKPNDANRPNNLNPVRLVEQLRYAGVIEAVRVARAGFPVRYSHQHFVKWYDVISPRASEKLHSDPSGAVDILLSDLAQEVLGNKKKRGSIAFSVDSEKGDSNQSPKDILCKKIGIRCGKTKVFLRKSAFEAMELLRAHHLAMYAVSIQTTFRGYRARMAFRRQLCQIILLQTIWKRKLAYIVYSKRKQAYEEEQRLIEEERRRIEVERLRREEEERIRREKEEKEERIRREKQEEEDRIRREKEEEEDRIRREKEEEEERRRRAREEELERIRREKEAELERLRIEQEERDERIRQEREAKLRAEQEEIERLRREEEERREQARHEREEAERIKREERERIKREREEAERHRREEYELELRLREEQERIRREEEEYERRRREDEIIRRREEEERRKREENERWRRERAEELQKREAEADERLKRRERETFEQHRKRMLARKGKDAHLSIEPLSSTSNQVYSPSHHSLTMSSSRNRSSITKDGVEVHKNFLRKHTGTKIVTRKIDDQTQPSYNRLIAQLNDDSNNYQQQTGDLPKSLRLEESTSRRIENRTSRRRRESNISRILPSNGGSSNNSSANYQTRPMRSKTMPPKKKISADDNDDDKEENDNEVSVYSGDEYVPHNYDDNQNENHDDQQSMYSREDQSVQWSYAQQETLSHN